MEILEKEVFTLRMKCHEYELRLREVNLHGLNGATLQSENESLRSKLVELNNEKEAFQEKYDKLVNICIQAQKGITKGEEMVRNLQIELSELKNVQDDFNGLKTEIESMRNENMDLRKIKTDNDSLVIKFEALSRESEGLRNDSEVLKILQHEHELLQKESCKLKNELKNAKEEEIQMQEEYHSKLLKEIEIIQSTIEKENKSLSNEKLALTKENAILSSTKTNLKHEMDRIKLKLHSLEQENKEMKDELASTSILLKTFDDQKKIQIDSLINKYDEKIANLERYHESFKRDMQQANSLNMIEVREEVERLSKEKLQLKHKYDNECHLLKIRYENVTRELETTKKKWANSIASRNQLSGGNTVRPYAGRAAPRPNASRRSFSMDPTEKPRVPALDGKALRSNIDAFNQGRSLTPQSKGSKTTRYTSISQVLNKQRALGSTIGSEATTETCPTLEMDNTSLGLNAKLNLLSLDSENPDENKNRSNLLSKINDITENVERDSVLKAPSSNINRVTKKQSIKVESRFLKQGS